MTKTVQFLSCGMLCSVKLHSRFFTTAVSPGRINKAGSWIFKNAYKTINKSWDSYYLLYILNLVFARLETLNSGLLCIFCHILITIRN